MLCFYPYKFNKFIQKETLNNLNITTITVLSFITDKTVILYMDFDTIVCLFYILFITPAKIGTKLEDSKIININGLLA